MNYKNKNVVVLGMGVSGLAAAALLLKQGARVTLCESTIDEASRKKAVEMEAQGMRVLLGDGAHTDESRYELAVLSPGIPPEKSIVRNVVSKGIPMIGELELAFEMGSWPVIAITGTNGKTTTTALTADMLNKCGFRTQACGNIGEPFSAVVMQNPSLDGVVIEVSSFQLESIRSFRPHVAAWLNFSPNHLDRYRSVKEYRNAKLRIFENMGADDFAVVREGENLPLLSAQKTTFRADSADADFTLREGIIFYKDKAIIDARTTSLHGMHNAENLMAALGIGHALGLDFASMAKAVVDFHPTAHRCEFVGEYHGVRWINDAKSTNLDALEKALLSQSTPVILIAGGKDKGFDFDSLRSLVKERVRQVVLIGEMRERIARSWAETPSYQAVSLEDAVKVAAAEARFGETVLFSPGTSSYDMFRNYLERGERFKALVHSLSEESLSFSPQP